jgi:FtsH-binding integral membrane protein
VGNIVTSIALICCRGISRRVPMNYILLGVFTLCEAYLLAFIAATYEPEVVLSAAFSTAAITIAISLYAWKTKSDFTVCGPLFLLLGVTLCMTTLFLVIFGLISGQFRVVHYIICGIAVLLFSFYLLFDTQLIMGGKRYEIEIDDYILGAVILYTDIVTIFLYLLKIFGGK